MSAGTERLQEILLKNFFELETRIANAPQDQALRANFNSATLAYHTIYHAKVEDSSFVFNWRPHRDSDEITLVLFCKNLQAEFEYASCDPLQAVEYIEKFRVRYRQLHAYGISY